MRWTRCQLTVAAAMAGAIVLAGCGGVRKDIDKINRSNEAYSELQSFIQRQLTTKFHRSVRSVSCTPHVSEVVPNNTAHMNCLVRFTDGTSYVSPAAVIDPSTDIDIATYSYRFTDPPAVDITTAPLPVPTIRLSTASSSSLLAEANLKPLVRRLRTQFSRYLIIQLVISPGEIQAVMAAGGKARLVTASYSGSITAGALTGFSGSRNAIAFSQFKPAVIQRLAVQLVSKAGVPASRISRFVLTNSLPDGNSGWNIYLTSGSTRFQALVLGQQLTEISTAGRKALN